jgi:hypothetical protein
MTKTTATKTTAQAQPTTTEVAQTAGNVTYYLAKAIVIGFAAGCLYFSFNHTIHLAHMLGATGAQAYSTPAFVDGFMLLGRLGMADAFDASTRKIGRRMMVVGALLSLIANVAAGQTLGDRIIGALVVIGFLVTEWYAGKLKPAPAPELTPAQKAAITKARNAAAAKAAGTTPAKRKPAAKSTNKTPTVKTRTRKATPVTPTHPVAAIEALSTTLPVPISGAPVGYNNGLVIAYSLDDIAALTN